MSFAPNDVPKKVGRYVILESLGYGAMGAVYKAEDPRIRRIVAIKTIRLDVPPDSPHYKSFLHRFYTEARISGALSHPNIVTLYDIGETENRVPFLAMEYVDGENIADLLARGERLRPEQVVGLVSQMASAIDYAHTKGVIHRDIKPSNIIVYEGEKVKITDFGIAKLMDAEGTQTASLLGTPSYMSPEQAMGEELDGRTDIFSLGVVAFEMLSGQQPFPGNNVTSILYKLVHSEPVRPTNLEVIGLLPEKWHQVFSRVLAKNPAERYGSASEFVSDLELCLGSWFGALEGETLIMSPKASEGAASDEEPTTQGQVPVDETVLVGGPKSKAGTEARPSEPVAASEVEKEEEKPEPEQTVLLPQAPEDVEVTVWKGRDDNAVKTKPVRRPAVPEITAHPRPPSPAQPTDEGTILLPTAQASDEGTVLLPTAPQSDEGTVLLPTSPSTDEGTILLPARGAKTPGRPSAPAAPPPAPQGSAETVLIPAPVPEAPPEEAVAPPEAAAPPEEEAPVSVEPAGEPRPERRKRSYVLPVALVAVVLVAAAAVIGVLRIYRALREEIPRVPPTPPPEVVGETPATPVTGVLAIVSDPEGATAFVNGKNVGVTPVEVPKLALGVYTVRVEMKGYQIEERTAELTGQNLAPRVEFPLKRAASTARPREAFLDIRSTPSGAEVLVDGQPAGNTPVAKYRTDPGKRVVRVEKEGFQAWEKTFELKLGATQTVDANLEPIEVAPPPPVEPPLPPEVRPGELVRPGPEVVDPKCVRCPTVSYPDVAKKGKLEALVVVSFIVTEAGSVEDIKIEESGGEIFDQAVLNVVRDWKFSPPTKKGVPVKMRVTRRFRFQRGR